VRSEFEGTQFGASARGPVSDEGLWRGEQKLMCQFKNGLDHGTYSGVDTDLVATMKANFRSGELAKATGVSTDTLRHYEKLGILTRPQRTQNGYRIYPPESFERVRLIRNALDSGFTLRELKNILSVRDAGGAPCRQVVELARDKVRELGAQIERLCCLRDSIKLTVIDWDRRLSETPAVGRAHLLESLSGVLNGNSVKGESDEHFASSVRAGNTGFRQRPKRN